MKNGIIIPTHPDYFHWTEQMLASAQNENIILVFSSKEDQDNLKHDCRSIVVPPKPNNYESVVAYKKIKALSLLYKEYDYLATMDTEILFLRPTTPHLKSIWDNNCIIANCSLKGATIINQCLEDLNLKDYPYSTNLYYWFNEIQVYPTYLVQEFLDWLPSNIRNLSFDYLLFSIFMITKHNHELKLIKGISNYSIIEDYFEKPEFHYLAEKVNWSTYFSGVEKLDNIKVLFHLDRVPLPKDFKL